MKTDEGARLDTDWSLLKGTFWKVENSKFLSLIKEESSGLYGEHIPVEYFVIITENDIVEVISTYAPEVEINEYGIIQIVKDILIDYQVRKKEINDGLSVFLL